MTILVGLGTGVLILIAGLWLMHVAAKEGGRSGRRGIWTPLAILGGFLGGLYMLARISPILALMVILLASIPVAFFLTPFIASIMARPITAALMGETEEEPPKPFYSSVVGRRKSGDVAGALAALAEQRRLFPNDLAGVLLEADIHRRDRRSGDDAVACLEQWLAEAERSAEDTAVVLRDVAEIRLGQGREEEGREVLQRIVEANPKSTAGVAAAQRLAHIADPAAAAEQLSASLKLTGRTFAKDIGLRADGGASLATGADPDAQRRRLEEQVAQHPEDWDSRSALARLEDEAGNYAKAAAIFQELAAIQSAPPRTWAKWLNDLADLHIRHEQFAAARDALQRVVERLPDSAHASLAESRIRFLPLEARGRKSGLTVTMPGQKPPGEAA